MTAPLNTSEESQSGVTKSGVMERGYADTSVRVRYAETDQMGVVYHANYLVWFEVGRVELIRALGLPYAEMEREGALIAVVEARARYKAPARYDDELVVRTRVAGFRGSIVRFTYEVRRAGDETLLCEGETVHLVVGRDMKRRDMPAKFAALFRALQHRMGGEAKGESGDSKGDSSEAQSESDKAKATQQRGGSDE